MIIKIFIVFWFFLGLFGAFLVYTKRFYNCFKLYYCFGLKGAGKTCYFISRMLYYKKRGWLIYSDFPVNIPGVRIFNSIDLKDHRPECNSVIFCDEAHLKWDNRNFKNFDKGYNEFYSLQRHFKTIVYLNAQTWAIDKKIRDQIDVFYFISNFRNCISFVKPIHRILKPVPSTAGEDSRIADDLQFSHFWHWRFYWMPKYYGYYNSFWIPDRPFLAYKTVPDPDQPGTGQQVDPDHVEVISS